MYLHREEMDEEKEWGYKMSLKIAQNQVCISLNSLNTAEFAISTPPLEPILALNQGCGYLRRFKKNHRSRVILKK